jgi:[ribosomal protein S5]-alanine N-acetyltransferase
LSHLVRCYLECVFYFKAVLNSFVRTGGARDFYSTLVANRYKTLRNYCVKKMTYILQTNRLQLQPCQMEDILIIHSLWTNDQMRYFLFDDRIISLDEARSFIEDSIANFTQYGYGLWLVFASGIEQLVGFAGLLASETVTPGLIYGIHPNLWGQGYATEAASAVLNYALDKLGFPKVIADVDEPNIASVRVLEKVGMKLTKRDIVNDRPLLYFERSLL